MQRPGNGTLPLVSLVGMFISVACNNVLAGNWTITPTLQFQEIYSDNVQLAQPGNEKGAIVSEISPGISIFRQSGRNTLNLNYRMQNLYNASGSNDVSTFNQLQFNTNNTLSPNRFFLNARSSISQQNTSNSRIATDNISGSGNRSNVSTFSLSPTWTPHFGNYANGSVGASVDTVTTDTGSSGVAGLSDTLNLGQIVQLNSGIEFKRIKWNMYLNNRDNYRATGNDVSFQNSSATIRTYLNRYFNVFFQGGHSNNSFQSSTGINNGLFYTVGGQWAPSRLYSLEAGYGNNSHVTLSISPMQRLTWVTTFRDNQIGLNSGQTWQTALNYRTRRSTWSLSHNNDTTTTQALLLEPRLFTVDINPDPNIDQLVQFIINIPTLTDQVIITKTLSLSTSFNTGKSTMGFSLFSQDREFQVTANKEKVIGINANWNWRFTPNTSAYISPRWQQIDRGLAEKDNRYDFSIGLNRSITARVNGRLEFRHLDQSSALATNHFEENRATASLFMRF